MRVLSERELVGLEFPDAQIEGFEVSDTELKFVADGGYLEGEGVIDGRIRVAIDKWERASALCFNRTDQINLAWSEAGSLREICECSFEPAAVKLAGFERDSGLWHSLELISARVCVTVDDPAPKG